MLGTGEQTPPACLRCRIFFKKIIFTLHEIQKPSHFIYLTIIDLKLQIKYSQIKYLILNVNKFEYFATCEMYKFLILFSLGRDKWVTVETYPLALLQECARPNCGYVASTVNRWLNKALQNAGAIADQMDAAAP
jgi:hypothetical protein